MIREIYFNIFLYLCLTYRERAYLHWVFQKKKSLLVYCLHTCSLHIWKERLILASIDFRIGNPLEIQNFDVSYEWFGNSLHQLELLRARKPKHSLWPFWRRYARSVDARNRRGSSHAYF